MRLDVYPDLIGDLLYYDLGYRDIMVLQVHRKARPNYETTLDQQKVTPDDTFLLLAVDLQQTLGSNGQLVHTAPIDLLNDLAGEDSFGVLLALQVVFVEVNPLQGAVETFETRDGHRKGKGVLAGIDGTPQLIRGSPDGLQRCPRLKTDVPAHRGVRRWLSYQRC